MSTIVVGPIPPPINGASRITALMSTIFADTCEGDVTVVDTSVDPSARFYHARRCAEHLRAFFPLWKWRRAPNPICYIGGAGGGALYYQAVLILVASILGYKTIFHHHSWHVATNRPMAMRIIVYLSGSRVTHVVLCTSMQRALEDAYHIESQVVPNIAIVEASTLPPSLPRVTFGYLGTISHAKGFSCLARTIDLVLQSHSWCTFLLAGPVLSDASVALDRLLARWPDQVAYAGVIQPGQVDEFLSQCGTFLFPSIYVHEADPLVLLEAGRNGVGCITSGYGCSTDHSVYPWISAVAGLPQAFPETVLNHLESSPDAKSPTLSHRSEIAKSYLELSTEARNKLLSFLEGYIRDQRSTE